MRARYGLAFSLALVSLGSALPNPRALAAEPAPPVTLEIGGPLTVELGKRCVLTAETSAKKVTWKVPAGCDVLPLDGKRLAVWAPPGTYTFVAMAPAGDDVITSEVTLTVTGPRPPPVPVPPVPPNPPVPPTPIDPLTKALADAFATEAAPDKRERVKVLAGVMREGAKYATDPTVTTDGQLTAAVTKKRKADIGESLPAVRASIGAFLAAEFGIDLFNLNQTNRPKIQAAYTKLAAALEEVGK